jgi:hypothetical protein
MMLDDLKGCQRGFLVIVAILIAIAILLIILI